MKFQRMILLLAAPLLFGRQGDRFTDEPELDEYGSGAAYARLTYADRNVQVTREGDSENAIPNYPLTYGDVIDSQVGAYSEVEFIDGTLVQVDGSSRIEFQSISQVLDDEALTVINMYDGAVLFHVTDSRIDVDRRVFRVDTEAGSAYFDVPGVYYVEYHVRHMKLKVYRGIAELAGADGSTLLRSGEYATITGLSRPSRVRSFNAFQGNRFERWAYDRGPRSSSVSSNYVPDNLTYYASDLDNNGDWRYEGDLQTHVWVPSVTVSWSPYYRGYWTSCAGSMTWVSYDPFGWVTHHYGSWGWNLRWGWYWTPNRYYSPAWVAWSSYDNYVGWCPLGYWGRPYYYDRYGNHNTYIINHNRYYWNYVGVNEIHHRNVTVRRDSRRAVVRDVTTRPIHVSRSDIRNPRAVQTTIRDVDANRRSATQRQERVRIARPTGERVSREANVTRSSGTKAVSRYDTRETTRSYGSSTNRTTVTPRDSNGRTVRSTESPSRSTTTRQKPSQSRTEAPSRVVEPRERTSAPTRTESTPRTTTPPKQTPTRKPTTVKPRTESKPSRQSTPPRTTEPKERDRDDDRAPARRSEVMQQSTRSQPTSRTAAPSRTLKQRTTTTRAPQRSQRQTTTRSTKPKQPSSAARTSPPNSSPRASRPAPSRTTTRSSTSRPAQKTRTTSKPSSSQPTKATRSKAPAPKKSSATRSSSNKTRKVQQTRRKRD